MGVVDDIFKETELQTSSIGKAVCRKKDQDTEGIIQHQRRSKHTKRERREDGREEDLTGGRGQHNRCI